MAKVFKLHDWGPVGEDDYEQCYTCGISRKSVSLSDTKIADLVRECMEGKVTQEELEKKDVICYR